MSEFLFSTFKRLHRALRGTGLGRIRVLRDLRDRLYRVAKPTGPRIVEVGGFRLWVDPSTAGGVVPWLLLDGIHEPAETRCIAENLRPGGTFIDIGANIGYYTILAARTVGPTGRVFAFEPEPVNHNTLLLNIELNGLRNVTPEAFACSDRAAEIPLYLDDANAGGHHLHDVRDGAAATMIRAVALDDHLRGIGGTVDIIKMDIQGHEPVALRGMKEILTNHSEANLITEFDPPMIAAAGESPERYLSDLSSFGFRFTILSDYGRTLEDADPSSIFARCRDGEFVNLFCRR